MAISTASIPVPGRTRLPVGALLLLSLAVFLTVTAETLPAGLLPEMAAGLGATPAQIGLLISVWALTVIVTSLPLARATARIDRRLVVAVSLAVFAAANVATALAPGFGFAMGTRVVAAVAHGVFWAVVIVYASALLAPAQLGRGLAIVTAGGTAATVAGLPVATLLAQTTTWRTAFAAVGAISLALAFVVWRRMPRVAPPRAESAPGGRAPLRRDPSLPALAAFGAAAVLIAVAQFAAFTYIRPYLEVSASIGPEWAAALLFAYGMAGMVGVAVAGVLADRHPRAAIVGVLVTFAAAFAALTAGAGSVAVVVAALAAWGFAIGAVFPLLQSTLMRVASDRTRTLASAGMVVLFNVGIAAGPWLGGLLGGEREPTVNTAVSAVAMVAAAVLGVVGALLARDRLVVRR